MQVMSYIPWEFRDSSLLKKSHSLLLVSEILLHPNVYYISVKSVWGERVLKTSREPESGEGASFPHALPSFRVLSLPACQYPAAALLTNISLWGHSRTASLIWCGIFSRPYSLILGRHLLHLLSGDSTQKTWKRKKKKPLYLCGSMNRRGHWSQGFTVHQHRTETEPLSSIHTV